MSDHDHSELPAEPHPDADTPSEPVATKPRTLVWRLVAVTVATVVTLLAVEVALRLLHEPPQTPGKLYFRDKDGEAVGEPGREDLVFAEAVRRGLIELLPPNQSPRPRQRFAPGAHFYMCYQDHEQLDRGWFDDRGCVEVRINSFGLREREELRPDNKQPGEQRIVCIGDSFTFGWGIPVEQGWVRLLEEDLRRDGGDVRTINCGASGALVVDEYWWGLRTRFGLFDPDVVVVSLYLNDLLPSSGLCVLGPQPQASGLRLIDVVQRAMARDPLDLDPNHDWVGELLALPKESGEAGGFYGADKPFEAMWSQHKPQRSLVAMRDWCEKRKIPMLVILWPFLQGLGPTMSYPFQAMHDQVEEFCRKMQIPFLDLLPELDKVAAASLWVTPSDLHANPTAQQLVLPALANFVRPYLSK